MVSVEVKAEKREAEYSLSCIKRLAAEGSVSYASSRVQRHIENLDYSPSDVHECLSKLTPEHYQKSILYENRPSWLDVYHIRYAASGSYEEDLYIKLKLNRDCIIVELHSFHPEGWL
ncbi:type II toxin-antitoxin system MqsR family toxin [Sedimenticola selenatireducens]|uniref:type II toxin-antitoxin system MqsR family toxin n=1 Tax=Sedimenticola selenatireducens TaxID=191960 RepID=UPI002AABDB50|nr:type II toxin-antitoxin system MqsR family toxin [Sedimenticola selenatireducens]